MSEEVAIKNEARERLLSPVDRVSEMLFGLFMALTFVGAVSAATAGKEEIRTLFITAFGCNIAWGLVDAVMYLVRTITERGRRLTLARAVRSAPDAEAGRRVVASTFSDFAPGLVADAELEAIRARIVALPGLPDRPVLGRDDALAAVAIFLIVVAATFPVVIPFAVIADVDTAKNVSRILALAMLFLGGLALGRYAGYGSLRTGFVMAGLGAALVVAVIALGG
jgi:VIT1/CCC1 family predicted Fe2+/Mn2+ transporter